MAKTLRKELLVALREQLLVALTDAADRNLSLTARGFASVGCAVVAARNALSCFETLPLLESVVVGLRFSARARGLSRAATAELLGLPVSEVERLEDSALAELPLVMEVY